MTPYPNFSSASMLLNLKENKISGIDCFSGYSKFYYYASYYVNIIFKDPAAHNKQK